MDKENLNFDKEVKNILNEEVNFVPDNINKAFDEALLKAQATKKKRKIIIHQEFVKYIHHPLNKDIFHVHILQHTLDSVIY